MIQKKKNTETFSFCNLQSATSTAKSLDHLHPKETINNNNYKRYNAQLLFSVSKKYSKQRHKNC